MASADASEHSLSAKALLDSDGAPRMSHADHKASSFRAALIGGAGNVSISWNLTALSIALAFLQTPGFPEFAEPSWSKIVTLGAAFAGTLIGMVLFGAVADTFGRRPGLLGTLGLVVIGCAGTALASWGSPASIYGIVAFSRLLVGIGVGGTYPCAFATVAESGHQEEDAHTTNEKLGIAYAWQIPGSMGPYLMGIILAAALPDTPAAASAGFRVILLIGLVPAAVAWWAAFKTPAPPPAPAHKDHGAVRVVSIANESLFAPSMRRHLWTLVGTAGTWLCYDLGYYGTAVFLPAILKSIFGDGQTVLAISWQSLAIAAIGSPGTVLAIWNMRTHGARWLNIWGFLATGVTFAILAVLFYADTGAWPKFVALCALMFALSWGPCVAVHVLAAQAYPKDIRGRFIGLSAAGGKTGAIIGTFVFQPLADAFGTQGVMIFQVITCVVGLLLSLVFLESDKPTPRSADAAAAVAAAVMADTAVDDSAIAEWGASGSASASAPAAVAEPHHHAPTYAHSDEHEAPECELVNVGSFTDSSPLARHSA